jgi:hypothetical protein
MRAAAAICPLRQIARRFQTREVGMPTVSGAVGAPVVIVRPKRNSFPRLDCCEDGDRSQVRAYRASVGRA